LLRGQRLFQCGGRFVAAAAAIPGVILLLVPPDELVVGEGVHRDAIRLAASLQMSMREDELRWIVIIAEIASKGRAAHPDLDVLADFQMQVGIVEAVGIADRGDLLAARHGLAAMDQHFLHMAIERIDIFYRAAFAKGVPHDHHVSPPLMTIARKNDYAVADAVNWIAQIGVAAPNAIPIFPEVSMRPETARLVITLCVRFSHRKIKPIGQLRKRGRALKADRLDGARLWFARLLRR
jgi:hypothetical protein